MILQELQLAKFTELNPYPIIEISNDGQIVYVNLAARTEFPDLMAMGLNHPVLQDLQSQISSLQPLHESQFTVFNREITFNNRCYEQQFFGLPDAYIFIFMVDVSERNQLREQAHFNDKLAALGTLAAGIAHEVRNPITWILGNLSLLQSSALQLKKFSSDSRVHNFIDQMEELLAESFQGMELIRDITDSLKGLARHDSQETVPVDLHKVLNMIISMALMQFKKNIHFKKKFAENIPLLESNSGKLHQVFLNLVINAAQAATDDKRPNIITISTLLDQGRVKIDISDTGKGIAPENLAKIFAPFFTTKRPGQGTGLGLAICREIINELQGDIRVQSKLGVGTTFTVDLPIVLASMQNKVNNAVPESNGHKKRILVVDNEPTLLKLLKRILEDKHEITTAKTGNEAKELLLGDSNQFDVVITDLNMPDISGADLYQMVAEHAPGTEKRFIFITGGTSMHWVKEFLTSVDNPVLEKPFFPDQVLKLVDKMPSV